LENTESEVSIQTDSDNTPKPKYKLQEQFEKFVLKKESTANIPWDSVLTELEEIVGGLLPQDGSEDPASSNPVYRLSFSGVPGSLQAHLRLGDQGKVNLQPHLVIAAEIFEPVNPVDKQLLMVRIKVFATHGQSAGFVSG
jgi:hypothetical protein